MVGRLSPFVGSNPSFKTMAVRGLSGPLPEERSERLTGSQAALPGAGGMSAAECFWKRMEGNSPEIFFSLDFQKLHLGLFYFKWITALEDWNKMLLAPKTTVMWNSVALCQEHANQNVCIGPGFCAPALAEDFFRRSSHHPFLGGHSGQLHQSPMCGWPHPLDTISSSGQFL